MVILSWRGVFGREREREKEFFFFNFIFSFLRWRVFFFLFFFLIWILIWLGGSWPLSLSLSHCPLELRALKNLTPTFTFNSLFPEGMV